MSERIQSITMPKWGLAMTEGMVSAWLVDEGADIELGEEIADIETTKITNAFEAPVAGKLRRQIAPEGEMVPVGSLLAVVADAQVSDQEINQFVDDFNANFDAAEAVAAAGQEPEPEAIAVGPRTIRFLATGDGDGLPLVLVHGFGGDLNNWMFNQPALAEHRPVVAVDLPGHGGSSKAVDTGDVAELAQAVIDFLAARGIERCHFGGHSLGGAVCLAVAGRMPALAASVTLVCPAGLGADINMDYINGFIGESRRKKLKPVLEQLFYDTDLVSRDMIDDVLKFKRLDGVGAALQKIADAVFAGGRQVETFRDQLGALAGSVQVIWGGDDRIVPAAHGADLPAAAVWHQLDQAGHMVHMEKAGEVNEIWTAFLARHD